jgi:hypothetical protein
MRFFGFGKKRALDAFRPPVTPGEPEASPPLPVPIQEIIVYGSTDGTRCRQVRALLERRAFPFQDVRVDEDLSTRSWLQRTTGDDALPKVFVGPKCYGGFEDIQVLVFDGRFERILRGEVEQDRETDELTAWKTEMSAGNVCTLLRQGAILTMTEGEMVTDVWAEALANPPLVYYEGAPYPIAELERIVARIVRRVQAGEIRVSWKEDD